MGAVVLLKEEHSTIYLAKVKEVLQKGRIMTKVKQRVFFPRF